MLFLRVWLQVGDLLYMCLPYLCQFEHSFHGSLVLNKVIFHISIICEISETLNSPISCFRVNFRIT